MAAILVLAYLLQFSCDFEKSSEESEQHILAIIK